MSSNQLDNYAPVVLFVYNRPDHLMKTLEALSLNHLVQETPLYIFSDGAKTNEEAKQVSLVRRLCYELKKKDIFLSVHIFENNTNLGLANSVIGGVTNIINKHNSVIVLEDDIVTSKNFLAYMNNVLKHYNPDKSVFSVTGYVFPSKVFSIDNKYPYDTFSGFRCSSWSWGTWVDRWNSVDWDIPNYKSFIRDEKKKEEFNRGGSDMSEMLDMQMKGKIDSWAIRFCYSHYINNAICIYPVKELVRNIGLDNSGAHCGKNPLLEHKKLDDGWLPQKFCPSFPVNNEINKRYASVFSNKHSNVTIIKMKLIDLMKRLTKNTIKK